MPADICPTCHNLNDEDRHRTDLLWASDPTGEVSDYGIEAPSSSWASIHGTVRPFMASIDGNINFAFMSMCTIVDAQCEVLGLNPFGAVSGGFLKIEAALATVQVSHQTDSGSRGFLTFNGEQPRRYGWIGPIKDEGFEFYPDTNLESTALVPLADPENYDIESDSEFDLRCRDPQVSIQRSNAKGSIPGGTVSCLFIGELAGWDYEVNYALVLGNPSGNRRHYQKMGCLELHGSSKLLDSARKKTVVIVGGMWPLEFELRNTRSNC